MSQTIRVESAGLTHSGMRRKVNEDAFAILDDAGLFVVCDGVGGAAAGDFASRLAVDTVVEAYRDVTWPCAGTAPDPVNLSFLVDSIQRASARIHSAAQAEAARQGMATTIAAVAADAATACVAHVGDSRVYLLRDRALECLTRDHSAINDLVLAGLANPEDSADLGLNHVITRALGLQASVDVEAVIRPTLPGDLMLLCSDGLSGPVTDAAIAAILLKERDLGVAAARLVDCANDAGGPDNVTVVLVRWPVT